MDGWFKKLQDDSLPASVVKRRCRLARTSVEGREKADIMLDCGDKGEKGASAGGERGEGNRSSSSRSPKPFLKAIMNNSTCTRTDQSYTGEPDMSAIATDNGDRSNNARQDN